MVLEPEGLEREDGVLHEHVVRHALHVARGAAEVVVPVSFVVVVVVVVVCCVLLLLCVGDE